jgi:hypothetical protein
LRKKPEIKAEPEHEQVTADVTKVVDINEGTLKKE